MLGGSKNDPNLQKSSVVSSISGTIYHMIFIHGTHVENHNISMFFLHFSEIIFFGVSRGVKGQKMAQNDKKLSVALHILESIHHVIVFFGGHLKNDDISRCFFHFFSKC